MKMKKIPFLHTTYAFFLCPRDTICVTNRGYFIFNKTFSYFSLYNFFKIIFKIVIHGFKSIITIFFSCVKLF
jgi:hypothetical protein